MRPSKQSLIGALLALAIGASACVSGGGSAGPTQTPILADSPSPVVAASVLDDTLNAKAGELDLPGAVAGVWFPEGEPWTQVYGDVTTDMRFPIRSITKSFTVTLLLMLVEEGEVSLDDPISDYVEGVPSGDKITLRQLASMTSGLPDYSQSKEFQKKFSEDFARQWTTKQLLDYAFAMKPAFAPGDGYLYSNTNTVLLGEVVEKVTEQPLEELYATRIWEPLGMTSSSYPDSADLPPDTAEPFLIDPETGTHDPAPLVNLSALGASGGIVSTLEDLHFWGEALGAGTLVGPTMQLEREQAAAPVDGGPDYDAYGLGIGEIDGWWGHSGEGIGYNAIVMRQAGTGAIIVVLVNSSQEVNAATEIFKALAEQVGTPT